MYISTIVNRICYHVQYIQYIDIDIDIGCRLLVHTGIVIHHEGHLSAAQSEGGHAVGEAGGAAGARPELHYQVQDATSLTDFPVCMYLCNI